MAKIKRETHSGPMPILCAHPVVLVGANIDDKPDFTTVAWTGVAASFPPSISIALQPHRYSLKGIRQNMTFSVNIPSVDNIKEADYCGLVSGSITDKVKDCGFKIFYGSITTAPLIEQFPVNHVCEVSQILNLGSHSMVVGKIVETFYSDTCTTEGKLDIDKVNPFIFTFNGSYYSLGNMVGRSFNTGSSINPEKAGKGRRSNPPPPPDR